MEQQYLNEFHMRNSQACLRDRKSCAQRPLSVEDVLAQSRKQGRFMIRMTSSAKRAFKNKQLKHGQDCQELGLKTRKSILTIYVINVLRLALDRIIIHNALFPETVLKVLGFARDSKENFEFHFYTFPLKNKKSRSICLSHASLMGPLRKKNP